MSIKVKLNLVYSKIVNNLLFKYKKAEIGKNLQVYGRIKIIGGRNKLHIGQNVILRSGIMTNPLGGGTQLVFAIGKDASLYIGNNVGISNTCIRIENPLIIEDNVNIGGDCKIYDTDMHSLNYEERVHLIEEHIKSAPIKIERGAWIGAHSIILKGVTIGERSVVGAGSVVTKSIPNDQLWAGNPARYIRDLNQK